MARCGPGTGKAGNGGAFPARCGAGHLPAVASVPPVAGSAGVVVSGAQTVYSLINSMADTLAGVLKGQDEQEQVIQQYLDKIGNQIVPKDITPPKPSSITDIAHANRGVIETQFYPVP